MTSPENNIQDLQQYNSEDAFETYIDADFLKNEVIDMDLLKTEVMDEDVDINNMSDSDLFRYFLEGELHKDEALNNGSPLLTAPMQEMSPEFALLTNPPSNEYNQYAETNSLSPNTPISPTVSISEIQQQHPLQPAAVDGAAVGTSLATLNAQLSELLAKLPLIKQETTDGAKAGAGAASVTTFKAIGTGVAPRSTANIGGSIKTADDTPSDLKKLTSKERRQIRNKISARNFRVRRKEYITNLESTNQQQQEQIDLLRQAVQKLQDENAKLHSEVEELRKRQPNGSKVLIVSSPPSSPHGYVLKDSASIPPVPSKANSSSNARGKPIAQPQQSSSLIPTLNKDTSPTPKTYRDPRVRVQTMFVPEFSLDKHMFENKSPYAFAGAHHTGDKNTFSIFETEKGHKAWLVFNLCSAVLQQMMTLFVEAVCAIPPQEMLPLLYPEAVYAPPEQTPVEQNTMQASMDEDRTSQQDVSSTAPNEPQHALAEVATVESAIEASVLDWLYDNMVRQVIEQSQAESRLSDLTSDWVIDDFDDAMLHQLF